MRIEAGGPGSQKISRVMFNGEDVTLRCKAIDEEAGTVELYPTGPDGEVKMDLAPVLLHGTLNVHRGDNP